MTTIETTQIAGADKLVHLTIPVEEPNRRYHMLIVVTPEPDKTDAAIEGAKDWPVGYWLHKGREFFSPSARGI